MFEFQKVFDFWFWITPTVIVCVIASVLMMFLSVLRKFFGCLNCFEAIRLETFKKTTRGEKATRDFEKFIFNKRIKFNIGKHFISFFPAGDRSILVYEPCRIIKSPNSKDQIEKILFLTKGKKPINKDSIRYLISVEDLISGDLEICIPYRNNEKLKRKWYFIKAQKINYARSVFQRNVQSIFKKLLDYNELHFISLVEKSAFVLIFLSLVLMIFSLLFVSKNYIKGGLLLVTFIFVLLRFDKRYDEKIWTLIFIIISRFSFFNRFRN